METSSYKNPTCCQSAIENIFWQNGEWYCVEVYYTTDEVIPCSSGDDTFVAWHETMLDPLDDDECPFCGEKLRYD